MANRNACATATALSALVLLALTGCVSPPVPPIASVTFSQSEAVAGFDTNEYVQTDATELAKLHKLLTNFEISRDEDLENADPPCTEGVSTDVSIVFDDKSTSELYLDSCTAPHHAFEVQANRLFTDWREALADSS